AGCRNVVEFHPLDEPGRIETHDFEYVAANPGLAEVDVDGAQRERPAHEGPGSALQGEDLAVADLDQDFAVGDFDARIDRGHSNMLLGRGRQAEEVGELDRPRRALHRAESCGEIEGIAGELPAARDL